VFATSSFADRPTFAVGASVAYGGYTASGQENEGAGSPQEINKKDATGAYGYTSLFVEASFADRVTIGASWMADAIQSEVTERTDSLCSITTKLPIEGCSSILDSGNDTGTSSVSARFSNLVTGYVELSIWNGLYAKYGIMEMDVDTKESLHTNSSYPNTTMDGTTYGLGWKGSFDNGVFIKTETMMQDWSDLHIEATGVRTGGTDNNNSIDVSLSGALATISIGKAF
jgi:hypothetical protein